MWRYRAGDRVVVSPPGAPCVARTVDPYLAPRHCTDSFHTSPPSLARTVPCDTATRSSLPPAFRATQFIRAHAPSRVNQLCGSRHFVFLSYHYSLAEMKTMKKGKTSLIRRPEAVIWSSLDKKIIEYARQHPLIYDAKAGNYKKTDRDLIVRSLWLKFVNMEYTNKTAAQCSKRWGDISRQYKMKKGHAKFPHSKFNDGRLSFLDYLIEKKEIMETEPSRRVPSVKVGSRRKKDVRSKCTNVTNYVQKLLNSSVVTLDMIDDILKLKNEEDRLQKILHVEDSLNETSAFSNEMDSANKVPEEKNDVLICDSSSENAENNITNTNEKQSSSTASVLIYDSTGINISAIIENTLTNSRESTSSSTNKASQSTEARTKDADENLTIDTIEFFEDMGRYVSNHLSEKQQKKLRFMLRSLIAEQ
ncbi:hypothetical protein O0L34_g4575 [Tuta absoluta]|nr:hypothetical protein O0L34_g4575 [Tuta absoluta]